MDRDAALMTAMDELCLRSGFFWLRVDKGWWERRGSVAPSDGRICLRAFFGGGHEMCVTLAWSDVEDRFVFRDIFLDSEWVMFDFGRKGISVETICMKLRSYCEILGVMRMHGEE